MADIIKCYKIRADFSEVENFSSFIDKVIKIGNIMFDKDNTIAVWLYDDCDKKDLIRTLKKNGISEFFCEPITYESIGKDKNYNFLSAWFMENYNAFVRRKAENQNQEQLREMYNNIQKAQAELNDKLTGVAKTSMTKQNFKKEARDV